MEFEWDAAKSRVNADKHGVSFEEASSVFGDPLALTFDDLPHSTAELRYLTFGVSAAGRSLVVVHTSRGDTIRIISSRPIHHASGEPMSSGKKPDDVRPEYDLAALKNGERGKYHKRYEQGSNVVVIDPDLAEVFPNAKAVNDALREVLSRRQREDASAE